MKIKYNVELFFLEVKSNISNPGFVNIGLTLGKEKLMSYIKKFGFGNKTGIDLNGEASGILFDTDKMGLVETATTAFGQGISVTPIQQTTAVSAVVNGGKLYTPYIIKHIIDTKNNSVLKTYNASLKRNVISKDTSDLMRFALENVVAGGTGRNAYIENYRVGGKTGTAQVVYDGHYAAGKYILSFIGFLPADDPKVVVYVAVNNAKNVTQYGGTVAAPVAKKVMQAAIDIFDIPASKEVLPRQYSWNDTKYILLSDVVGLNLKDAKKKLGGMNINVLGSGDVVKYQYPSAGSYVKESGDVELLVS